MEKLNLFQKILFWVFGMLALIGQVFGGMLVLIVIAFIIKSVAFGVVSCIIALLIDIYRHFTLKKLGLKPKIGKYE